MEKLQEAFGGLLTIVMVLFGLVVYFPGGTILMAMSCSHHRLDGLDWVLSVIIPGFGLFKALFSSAC